MTIYEMHVNFNVALDKVSSSSYPDIPLEKRDYFLNIGAERFIKQRYGISNIKNESFEHTQKRTDDLYTLVEYVDLIDAGPGEVIDDLVISRNFFLPGDYWFSIMDRALIWDPICRRLTWVFVKVARHNDIGLRFKDPFRRPKSWNVFRVQHNDNGGVGRIQIFLDNQSYVERYQLGYIRQYVKLRGLTPDFFGLLPNAAPPFTYQIYSPSPVNVTQNGQNTSLPFWGTQEYFLPLQTHQEIVDFAVHAALENIESPRYQTFLGEKNNNE